MNARIISAARLIFIDNSYNFIQSSKLIDSLRLPFIDIKWITGHGNIGYGRGHNLAIQNSNSDYHLILNPDVILAADAVSLAVEFMEQHIDAGVLAPSVTNSEGSPEYLCKRYPALIDLALRGFAPKWLQRLCYRRLAYYEIRDLIGTDTVIWDVPLISGCFMFCRGSLLRDLAGFNQIFFLYFEDYDLSLRAARNARTVYVPSIRIIHYGGQAARKGWRHIGFFARSAVRFYNQHGWRIW